MPVLRSLCMAVAMLGLAAEFGWVASAATWSGFQVQKILAVDAGRQRQLDILDRELEQVWGVTGKPVPASGEPASIVVAGVDR